MIAKVIWRNRWPVSAMTFVGMAALVFTVSFDAGMGEHGPHEILSASVGAAENMNQLVNKADVIVVGTIGSSVTERTIAPYSSRGTDEFLRMPVTDYEVTVTSVLKGDGDISSGDTLTLRKIGHLSRSNTGSVFYEKFPMSNVGDSRLFVLGKNPDDTTYGLYFGSYSRFDIDGKVIKYPDLDDDEVKFAQDVSPTDFFASIQQEVTSQGSR